MQRQFHLADGSTSTVHLNWKRQCSDSRDEQYRLKLPAGLIALPTSCDNRDICSAVEDQTTLGSCTAQMFAALIEANEIKGGAKLTLQATNLPTVAVSGISVAADGSTIFTTKVTPFVPAPTPPPSPKTLIQVSRLFGYYATRLIEGTVSEDSGASIRDTIKSGVTYGIADEAVWPYIVSKFAVKPPTTVWAAALQHKVTSYHSITDGDIQTIKATLASKTLVGLGIECYDYLLSEEMAKKGELPTPLASESLQGGHALAFVGYDDNKVITRGDGVREKGAFLVRNSWGTGWGLSGYFWMSYAYVLNTKLASDIWVVVSAAI